MVAPVTGPFSRVITYPGPPTSAGFIPIWVRSSRQWYRQRKPHNLPLNYSLSDRRLLSTTDPDNGWGYEQGPATYDYDVLYAGYNKAYERFKSKLYGDKAELAVSLAERKQAMNMVTNRCIQLYQFSRSLRKLRFREAANILGIQKIDDLNLVKKRGSKNFANNYLEFHFGWSPLVSDIGSAIDTLQNGVPPIRVRGTGNSKRIYMLSQPSSYYSWTSKKFDIHHMATIGATVQVTNPNLHLATQLGLVNPATIAWELVPFSFVVDWFVNVSDFLGQFTDFWGLSLTDTYRTHYQVYNYSETWYYGFTGVFRSVFVDRGLGIPGPTLRVRDPWILSPRRGLAAASLLVQMLKR